MPVMAILEVVNILAGKECINAVTTQPIKIIAATAVAAFVYANDGISTKTS